MRKYWKNSREHPSKFGTDTVPPRPNLNKSRQARGRNGLLAGGDPWTVTVNEYNRTDCNNIGKNAKH